jgi:hypothetical protein
MRGSVVAVSRAAARADCPIRLTGRSGASGAGCGQQTTPGPEGTPSLAALPGGEPSHGAICMTPGCWERNTAKYGLRELPLCTACAAALAGKVYQRPCAERAGQSPARPPDERSLAREHRGTAPLTP